MRQLLLGALLLLLTAQASFGSPILRAAEPIHDEYIVVLQDQLGRPVREVAGTLARAHSGKVLALYENTIKGFYVQMTEAQAEALSRNPQVQWVEENGIVHIQATQVIGPPQTTATNVPASFWGLDRIDQQAPAVLRLDNHYSSCSDGTSVRAYVVDTGILPTHAEFENRVDSAPHLTATLNNSNLGLGDQCWLNSGPNQFSPAASHGTAVASLIGGKTLGVAKKVTLVDARAMGCGGTGTSAHVTKVLDWIPTDPNRGTAPRVVNLSISDLTSSFDPDGLINAAINRLVDIHNITVVVAAGNFNDYASLYTPASASRAITVGGLSRASDTRWQYSNYGGPVSLYAPAQFVEAASTATRQFISTLTRDKYRSELSGCASFYAQDTCTSGTSFSAPFTTGAVALYLQRNSGATRDQALSYLQSQSAARSGIRVTEPDGRTVPILNVSDCPTIFTTQTPGEFLAASPGYEVATQFSASRSGYVTALRFYRAPSETGTNTLRLWTNSGTQLTWGQVNSGSGWVTADVTDTYLTAGTLYWVSVNTNTQQSKTGCGLGGTVVNVPLTAHGSAWGQPMGAMPTNGSCSNFFVDVIFDK